MCRILFIIHLVPLVLVELFICKKLIAKMDQNSDKYGQRSQVDLAVGLGAHMPCQLAPQGHYSMGAALEAMPSVDLSRFAMWLGHVTDLWELLQKQCQALI